jgi:uncharacterized membrane protein
MSKARRGLYMICVLAVLLGLSSCAAQGDQPGDEELWLQVIEDQRAVAARILSIDHDEWSEEEGSDVRTTLFTAEVTQGPLRGRQISGRLVEYAFMGYRTAPLRVGSRIYLQPVMEDTGPIGEFADYNRTWPVLFIVALFAVVLCFMGGMKGFRSLVALAATCLGLGFIFIPMVRSGSSPIGAALLVSAVVTIVAMFIIGGFGVKTFSSLLGILVGVATSGVLIVIMQAVMRLTGLVDNEAIRLTQLPGMEQLNMNGLMFAAILIGALGAAMDVAMSLASALEELHKKGGLSGLELMRSGMKIGRDTMGTMTNTLVLAYVGGSLHLIMLLAADMNQFGYMISWELLATEILRAMAGSIGLIVIVPATSLISALMYRGPGGSENPFS